MVWVFIYKYKKILVIIQIINNSDNNSVIISVIIQISNRGLHPAASGRMEKKTVL